MSWDDACIKWIEEKQHKRSLKDDAAKIRALRQFRGLLLKDINREFVMTVVKALPCGTATKNRYLALIRAILRKCEREWEWIDKAPCFTLFKEENQRIRWLKHDEANRLIEAAPAWMKDMIILSFMTGLRQANVLGLEWSQVDLERRYAWIHPDQAKAGLAIGVPLNDAACSAIRRNIGKHPRFVFVNTMGNPINDINSKSWSAVLKRAGIEDFRWHDMRHTWASWLVQAGVPLLDLKEMGGWSTIGMVQVYAHLSPVHLQKHADKLDILGATLTEESQNNVKKLTKPLHFGGSLEALVATPSVNKVLN